MSRRPNPSLSDIARGPRTAPGECEAWLVARAVEDVQREVVRLAALVDAPLADHERRLGKLERSRRNHNQRFDALASPPARATVERLPPGLSVAAHETLVRSENRASDAIAELADARRELAAAREERRMVGGWYNSCERFRTGLKAERDALQEQLAESRAALARIAEYQADPGRSFHQDYVNVKGIAKDALATATPEDLEAV